MRALAWTNFPTRSAAVADVAALCPASQEESLMNRWIRTALTLWVAFWTSHSVAQTSPTTSSAPAFAITFEARKSAASLDGRLFLLLSTDPAEEPRLQIDDTPKTQIVFGMDVENWPPAEPRVLEATNASIFGHPLRSLNDLKPGEYIVQALLDRYETFHRADGHVLKLPTDRGEGRQWNRAPGNLYSKPQKLRLDEATHQIALALTEEIPPISPPTNTPSVRHIRIQSERLSKFWGRPIYLGAHVLLPAGFDAHPEARYPLMVFHGHFPADISGLRMEPPDPNLKPDYSERFRIHGYNRIQQEEAYRFYQTWTNAGFPRFLITEIQHATQFYDDSYAVNSANVGPYGDAINYELIPEIEKRFRGLGAAWARFLYGGSTGGWEALATKVFYPDLYNAAFVACPDPIDFRAYTVINLYEDKNAYFIEGPHMRVPRPGHRDYRDLPTATMQQMNYYELALGTKSRSGQQFDIWEAVFSPVGAEGYPKRIFDKVTGAIDHTVAQYWREHYDLRYIMQRDWATLGPKLRGRIHLYCGTLDNFYLNNAVKLTEEFLNSATNPPAEAEVKYGLDCEHCWNGDPSLPNHLSRLRYNTMYVPMILEHIRHSAPAGADLQSWRQ
jgi:hypothetical protein